MRWCLAEACRHHWRNFLAGASTVALHEDKRKSKLGVRFTAANNNIERMSGVIGLKTVLGCVADLVKGGVGGARALCYTWTWASKPLK